MIKRATPFLVAAALAGCGADAATSTDSEQASAEDARVRFAECMREQGVDLPDPGPDGGIRIQRGPDAQEDNPQRFDEAMKKCEQHLEDARPPELSEEERQEFQDAALAFARCMREQGIDMPDPEFGKGGMIRQRVERGNGRENPRFREAEEKCEEYRPKPPGGGDGDGPRGGAVEVPAP